MQRNIGRSFNEPPRNSWPIARIALLTVALAGAIVLGLFVRTQPSTVAMRPPVVATAASLPIPSAPVAPPAIPREAGIALPIQIVVRRNDTLDAIFRRLSLDLGDLSAIRNLPGIRQSLDYLKPGDSIKLTRKDSEVRELSRRISDTQTLNVVRGDAGFTAQLSEDPVETRVRTATATIDSSLFQAADSADVSDAIALKLATVFAWDIDFVLDIREGDRFTAVYEQIYQDGKYARDGELLAAEFVNDGKVYRAVRFAQDGAVGYYTPQGQPMRKAFLRAPVDFTRVSSAFNPHRAHPILNIIRGHMGTDYAAPIGTPVHAAGDGRVGFEGVRGGYGNAIMLTHGSGVSTLYGHLSRFARNVHAGSHVQQGEIIAYVGMTGLATGPHLHYEYLIDGVHKDPQTVHLPGAEPLHADALQRFQLATTPLLAQLPTPPPASAAAVAAAPASAGPRLYRPCKTLRALSRDGLTNMALYLGLISGTSMDAIDAALVDFDSKPLRVVATSATAFAPALKARTAALIDRADNVALDEIGQLDVEIGRAFACASLGLLQSSGTSPSQVTAIGSHGQTLRHRPDLPARFTWQIGDPNVLAEMTGISVVADFRRRDVAAGGQGAPLLPLFHDQVFRSDDEDRVIANLGGIANITILRHGQPVTGFDTGPANRLLDAWTAKHQGRDFDADGRWAATGTVDDGLLATLLDEPYLRLPPPKSTGRELFNMDWLEARLGSAARRPEDVQATLQQFTAVSLADAVKQCAPGAAIYACGGGAHNHGLLEALARLTVPSRVASTAELGLDPDFVEAIAFAWFAKRTLAGLPSSAASVTGAKGARILGAIYA